MPKTYKLFTMPTCDKCMTIKKYLKEKNILFEDYNIAGEGMEEFRRHYPKIKKKVTRNKDGTLIIPIMLVFDDSGNIINFANKIEEIKRIIENRPLQEMQ